MCRHLASSSSTAGGYPQAPDPLKIFHEPYPDMPALSLYGLIASSRYSIKKHDFCQILCTLARRHVRRRRCSVSIATTRPCPNKSCTDFKSSRGYKYTTPQNSTSSSKTSSSSSITISGFLPTPYSKHHRPFIELPASHRLCSLYGALDVINRIHILIYSFVGKGIQQLTWQATFLYK